MNIDVLKLPVRNGRPERHVFSLSGDVPQACFTDLDSISAAKTDFAATLSNDEKDRSVAYRFAVDRDRFILRRGLLRQLLGGLTGRAADSIQFSYGSSGKPFLREFPNLHFSVTHSAGTACFGFCTHRRIGIDLEYRRNELDLAGMANTVFSEADIATIKTLRVDERPVAFFKAWTRLEALVKADGAGLVEQAMVQLLNGNDMSEVTFGGTEWLVSDTFVAPRFASAIAVEKSA